MAKSNLEARAIEAAREYLTRTGYDVKDAPEEISDTFQLVAREENEDGMKRTALVRVIVEESDTFHDDVIMKSQRKRYESLMVRYLTRATAEDMNTRIHCDTVRFIINGNMAMLKHHTNVLANGIDKE